MRDSTSRVTYQVAEKHKLSGVMTIQKLGSCRNGLSATRAPENTTFPVIGGGEGCIVLSVGDKVVRLIQHPETWVAEHLVVRGSGE